MSVLEKLPDNPDTYLPPEHGWTCFHCGETFRAPGLARAHFGHRVDGESACRLSRREGGLAFQLRQTEEHLARYRSEDDEMSRAMDRMMADHARALIREEEKGFNKGVKQAADEISSLRAQLAEAIRLLKPFAEYADQWASSASDAIQIGGRLYITLGQVRRTREFIEKVGK